MTKERSAAEAQASGADKVADVVGAGVGTRHHEDVVRLDLGDSTRRAAPRDRDLAALVELDGLHLSVVRGSDAGSGIERPDPLLENPEAAAVVQIDHVRVKRGRREHVGRSSGGAVALSVQHEVHVDSRQRIRSSAVAHGDGAPHLDALNHSLPAITRRRCVALRNQTELTGGRDLAGCVEEEVVRRVEVLLLRRQSEASRRHAITTVAAARASVARDDS